MLVIGGGSIGSRHLKNLAALGISSLGLVDIREQVRERCRKELGAESFATLEEGLAWAPQVALIATPSHLHIEQGIAIAEHGIDLFIEKPLSHWPQGISLLIEHLERRACVSLVGCNMRFHPGPTQIKKLLEKGRLGKILFARVHVGSYLPEWRPGSDYRQNYAANVETGGGCLLDCIHEIDLARWYLGGVEEVLAYTARLSTLEINTEDYAFLLLRHESGAISEVHLDYVQRSYERGCQIVGESGSLFWDYTCGTIRCYDAERREWSELKQPAGWAVNDMYVAEMEHFLHCVRERKRTMLPVAEAARLMDLVFAARMSAQEKRAVKLNKKAIA